MKKFIVIYHMPASAMDKMKDIGPEDSKKEMEQWMIWAKNCGEGLVDLGSPLGNGEKLSGSGSSPSKKNFVGYSILQAEDMDAAKEMLKEHPHLKWTDGCEIEVYECLHMPKSK